MLVIAGAAAAGFQTRETAKQGRAAFGMQFGREGVANGAGRIEAEHLEEGVVGVGEAARRIAAENRVALRIHQTFISHFALIEPPVHGRSIAQAGFQPCGRRLGLIGLAGEQIVALAAHQQNVDQERQGQRQQRAETGGGHDGEMTGEKNVGGGSDQHQSGQDPEYDPDDACNGQAVDAPYEGGHFAI